MVFNHFYLFLYDYYDYYDDFSDGFSDDFNDDDYDFGDFPIIANDWPLRVTLLNLSNLIY